MTHHADSMTSEIGDEMATFWAKQEHYAENMAGGILRLKKKYPQVYHYFEAKWDALFAEYSVGLNREARRRLR